MATESFKQGYRLKDGDLEESFWAYNVYYPDTFGNYYTPYWARYDVRWIHPTSGISYPLKPRYRIPYEVKTGILRPNFIIGDTWEPGTYEIRWKYKIWENSDIEYRRVFFTVTDAGLGSIPWDFEDYLDLAASMNVIL